MVTKKEYKGSCLVIWNCRDYITEVEKQLSHTKVYKYVSILAMRPYVTW